MHFPIKVVITRNHAAFSIHYKIFPFVKASIVYTQIQTSACKNFYIAAFRNTILNVINDILRITTGAQSMGIIVYHRKPFDIRTDIEKTDRK